MHSDSSEWVHDGAADGASYLEVPGKGLPLQLSAKARRDILTHCPEEESGCHV